MGEWQGIYHSILFAKPVLEWEDSITPEGRKDVPRFFRFDDAAQKFFDALAAIHSSNSPQDHLTLLPGTDDVFVLKEGGWIAYFVINQKIKKFYGLMATRETIATERLFFIIKQSRESLGC